VSTLSLHIESTDSMIDGSIRHTLNVCVALLAGPLSLLLSLAWCLLWTFEVFSKFYLGQHSGWHLTLQTRFVNKLETFINYRCS